MSTSMKERLVASPAGGFEVDLSEISDEARVILEELRGFEAAAHRIMFHPVLDTPGRQAALLRLMEGARASSWPEGACRAIERVVFEHIFGRGREDWYWEAAVEEAVTREREVRVAGTS